jgi:hypothetical protein
VLLLFVVVLLVLEAVVVTVPEIEPPIIDDEVGRGGLFGAAIAAAVAVRIRLPTVVDADDDVLVGGINGDGPPAAPLDVCCCWAAFNAKKRGGNGGFGYFACDCGGGGGGGVDNNGVGVFALPVVDVVVAEEEVGLTITLPHVVEVLLFSGVVVAAAAVGMDELPIDLFVQLT